MKIFSRLSHAFKGKSHHEARAEPASPGRTASKTVKLGQLQDALRQVHGRAQPRPRGISQEAGTGSKPRLVSPAQRSVSLPAAKQVHRPRTASPSDAKPVLERQGRSQSTAAVAKGKLPIEKRAHPYGVVRFEVVRLRSRTSQETYVKQGLNKHVDWVAKTARHKLHGQQAQARLAPATHSASLPGMAPAIQQSANEWDTLYCSLADEGLIRPGKEAASETAATVALQASPAVVEADDAEVLRQALYDGIHGDRSPKVVDLWLDVLDYFATLDWDIERNPAAAVQALLNLDPYQVSPQSSAIACAWVCALENQLWREDTGGPRNDLLEAHPRFYDINDKVEAYMRAHHAAQYRKVNAPVVASGAKLEAELDSLIAGFETMAWPQNGPVDQIGKR